MNAAVGGDTPESKRQITNGAPSQRPGGRLRDRLVPGQPVLDAPIPIRPKQLRIRGRRARSGRIRRAPRGRRQRLCRRAPRVALCLCLRAAGARRGRRVHEHERDAECEARGRAAGPAVQERDAQPVAHGEVRAIGRRAQAARARALRVAAVCEREARLDRVCAERRGGGGGGARWAREDAGVAAKAKFAGRGGGEQGEGVGGGVVADGIKAEAELIEGLEGVGVEQGCVGWLRGSARDGEGRFILGGDQSPG